MTTRWPDPNTDPPDSIGSGCIACGDPRADGFCDACAEAADAAEDAREQERAAQDAERERRAA